MSLRDKFEEYTIPSYGFPVVGLGKVRLSNYATFNEFFGLPNLSREQIINTYLMYIYSGHCMAPVATVNMELKLKADACNFLINACYA